MSTSWYYTADPAAASVVVRDNPLCDVGNSEAFSNDTARQHIIQSRNNTSRVVITDRQKQSAAAAAGFGIGRKNNELRMARNYLPGANQNEYQFYSSQSNIENIDQSSMYGAYRAVSATPDDNRYSNRYGGLIRQQTVSQSHDFVSPNTARRLQLEQMRRQGSGRATSTRGFGLELRNSVFAAIRSATTNIKGSRNNLRVVGPVGPLSESEGELMQSSCGKQSQMNRRSTQNKVSFDLMPSVATFGRDSTGVMATDTHYPNSNAEMMFNAESQGAVLDFRNRLGNIISHRQHNQRRQSNTSARRAGSGRVTNSRNFVLNIDRMRHCVQESTATQINECNGHDDFETTVALRNERDNHDDINYAEAATPFSDVEETPVHVEMDGANDIARSPEEPILASVPETISLKHAKTPDTICMAEVLMDLGDNEELSLKADVAIQANEDADTRALAEDATTSTPVTPALQLEYDDIDDFGDDNGENEFTGFDDCDIHDSQIEEHESKEKEKKKRAKQTPNRRLKKDFASRKSLASHGIKLDEESGLRRSTRTRMRPLEYWRNEKKSYGRNHNSLPTVKTVDLASPNPEWPMPKTKAKTEKNKTKVEKKKKQASQGNTAKANTGIHDRDKVHTSDDKADVSDTESEREESE